MKLYTFLDREAHIIEEVRAENHDEAIKKAVSKGINFDTDYYDEELKD